MILPIYPIDFISKINNTRQIYGDDTTVKASTLFIIGKRYLVVRGRNTYLYTFIGRNSDGNYCFGLSQNTFDPIERYLKLSYIELVTMRFLHDDIYNFRLPSGEIKSIQGNLDDVVLKVIKKYPKSKFIGCQEVDMTLVE